MRSFLQSLGVGVLTALIVKAIDALDGFVALQWIWNKFFMELWPIWIGLFAGGLYWIVKLLYTFHTKLKVIEQLEKREATRQFQAKLMNQPGIIRPPTDI